MTLTYAHPIAQPSYCAGQPPEARRSLRRAALLHDIGKLGISNRILDKTARSPLMSKPVSASIRSILAVFLSASIVFSRLW